MRRLFYRFSDQAVYYRSSPASRPCRTGRCRVRHVDYRRRMSIVGSFKKREWTASSPRRAMSAFRTVPTPTRRFLVDEAYPGQRDLDLSSEHAHPDRPRAGGHPSGFSVPTCCSTTSPCSAYSRRPPSRCAPSSPRDLRDRHLVQGQGRDGGDQAAGG